MADMAGMEGMDMSGMTLAMFQNMPVDMRTSMLFDMMMSMMPGMRDMQLMSPFFTSRKGQFFWLFSGARVESNGEFAGAIIGSFVFAALATIGVESAKKLVRSTMSRRRNGSLVAVMVSGVAHAFRLSLHYLAMLLIMTFNVWVFLAVVAGHGVGYALYLLVGGMFASKHQHDDGSAMGSAALSKAVDSSSDSDARAKEDCC